MGWFSTKPKETSDNKEDDSSSSVLELLDDTRETAASWIPQDIQKQWNIDFNHLQTKLSGDTIIMTALGCTSAVSFLVGYRLGRHRISPSWKRLTSVSDIPSSYVGPDAPFLKGRVLSVSDGDTVRFLHVPTRLFHTSYLTEGEKLSDVALPVRICTIDTPETAKFGKEGQPYGEEAKQKLESMVDQKMVQLKLLAKDQYGRAVAEIKFGPFWPFTKYADEQMLKAGLAEVYRGGGAVYGHKGMNAYVAMEEKAKRNGKGIWSDKKRESSSEFKARMKTET